MAEGKILEFMVAYKKYGIEAEFVREVAALRSLTPVPCTPDFIAGIINLHGRIVSVVDIQKLFNLPAQGLAELSRAVVIRNETMEFALLADSVTGFRYIPKSWIQRAPAEGARNEFLKGVTADRVSLLDGQKLLTDESLVVYEEVL